MQYTSKEVYEYISHETNDPIVERKTCTVSGQPFAIFQSDLDFYNKISPTFDGRRFQIPTPTLCPEERQCRRLMFRNERKLYRRKCDFSGRDIISIYSPDKTYKVYDQKIWRSDARDPMNYGMDFDFTKTFTEQFSRFDIIIPKRAFIRGTGSENCDYSNCIGASKDCYLVFDSDNNENCLFGNSIPYCKNSCDITYTNQSEGCYQVIDCTNCYELFYSQNCQNCSKSGYLLNCINCKECFGCKNLINKQYCIFGKQYTKEEYQEKILEITPNYYNNKINKNGGIEKDINPNCITINSDHVIGNMIYNSKNIKYSFDISDVNNISYSSIVRNGSNDNCDTYVCINESSRNYEGITLNKNCNNLSYCIDCRNNCYNLLYCKECKSCSNCLGCSGLVQKQYCIFNKQYTKDEYEKTVANIITHMQETGERGEFFHPSLSPFGYNETVAQEYFPLEKIEDKRGAMNDNRLSSISYFSSFGYQWSDYSSDPKIPAGATVLTGDQIPNDITTVTDDILKQVIICEISKRPFMIQKAELEFYRKHNLPLPRRHPDVRHEERMKLRPGRALYLRNCDQCNTTMLSVYDKEYDGKVYCEHCYQKEVFA